MRKGIEEDKMKLGILGDLHLTNTRPEKRIDNYWETLFGKVVQALAIFDDEGCDIVVQVGDFCDTPTVADRVKAEIIQLILDWKVEREEILCVFGQHDITGHSRSTLSNSPLAVLEAAGAVKILSDSPVITEKENDDIHFYGASFGEPVPKPSLDAYNVLVTHQMIGNRPLWPGQELPGPKQFLKKYPDYNLVLAGDYHYRFIETWNGRTIINPGAIIRKTIGKFDLEHRPAVVMFDTDTNESKVIELEFEPPEKVFNLARIAKKKDSAILEGLVDRLREGNSKNLCDWKRFLVKVLEERKSSDRVHKIINNCLEEVE